MLDPKLKSSIRRLWDKFWAGGITNPASAIEQISYLIFLRSLDTQESQRTSNDASHLSYFADHLNYRWSRLMILAKSSDPEKAKDIYILMRDEIFDFLKHLPTNGNTFATAMQDAVFIIPNPDLLHDAMLDIDALFDANEQAQDVKYDRDTPGDIYEELLSQLNLAGKNGQFRTPRHIIRTMVELVDPQFGEYICDPAAGTAGFLVAVHKWMLLEHPADPLISSPDPNDDPWDQFPDALLTPDQREQLNDGKFFIGYDIDKTMVRFGQMNMLLHGIKHPQFRYADTLSNSFNPQPRYFDVVMANPPFAGKIGSDKNNPSKRFPAVRDLRTDSTELLYLKLCDELLKRTKPFGRCAIIVPEGVLFGSSDANRQLRQSLLNENKLEAVISLPGGVFQPYAGVKTAILFFRRGVPNKQRQTPLIWFYEVTGDGFSLDARRSPQPIKDNLRVVPIVYRQWQQTGVAPAGSWIATYEQVAAREFNLTAGAYRPYTTHETQYENPGVILTQVLEAEVQLASQLKALEEKMAALGIILEPVGSKNAS